MAAPAPAAEEVAAAAIIERLSLSHVDRVGEPEQNQQQSAAATAVSASAAAGHGCQQQQQPVRLLVFFLNRLLNFRHAELEALVTLDAAPPHGGPAASASAPRLPPPPPPPLVPPPPTDALLAPPTAPLQPSSSSPTPTPTPKTFDMRWELPHGGDRLSPFWHATFPSERSARRAVERAALTRGVFEPWAEAGTMEELEARLRALPEARRAPWSSRDPGTRSFKLVVEAWGAKMPDAARRAATRRALSAAGLRSRVDLSSPDDEFWLIVAPGNVEAGWTAAAAAAAAGSEAEAGGDQGSGGGGGGGGAEGARAAAAAAADAPDGGAGKAAAARSADCPKAGEQWYLDLFCRGEGEGDGDPQGSASSPPQPPPPHPARNTLPYRAPTCLFFCRRVATCDRTATVTRYNLNERPYIGPTSMDPEMAAVMANAARAQKGQLAVDPFCGTGSILVALAAAGARVVGCDIDVKVLRDGHAADGNAAAALARRRPKNAPKRRTAKRQAARAAEAEAEAAEAAAAGGGGSADPITPEQPTPSPPVASDVLSNFEHYGLTPRLLDLVRLDAHRPLLRLDLPAMFDCVVADPPYGVRAGGRKSERVEGSLVRDRVTHVSKTFAYSLTECLEDLLDLSARLLRPGGRLVYFMPAVVPGGAAAAAAKAAVLAARRRRGGRGEEEEEQGVTDRGGGMRGGGVGGRREGGGKAVAEGAEAAEEMQGAQGGGELSAAGGRPEPEASASADASPSLSSSTSESEDDGDEDALLGREPPTHPCLYHVATCEQVLSSRYARRLVVMERNERPFCAEEAERHWRSASGARLADLSDGLLAAVRLPRAPKVTRRERRARKSAAVGGGGGEGMGNRGKHV